MDKHAEKTADKPAILPERIVFAEELPGGAMWSHVLKRHQSIRLVDVEGGANVGLLLYNRDLLTERYSMPDTLKAQHVAYLTKGRVVYSDMGRVLCSVTEDTAGWHDTLCGHLDARQSAAKYGLGRYQEHRNAYQRNAHDSFLVELGKWGLGKQDLVPNLNLFSKVVADEEGNLRLATEEVKAGRFVELRAEMNVLLVLTTCPHPLDPGRSYAPKKVSLTVWRSDPPAADDLCRLSRPENQRGFENTERFFV